MLKDEDYLEKRDAFTGEYQQVTDKDAEALYNSAIAISPAARSWARDMLQRDHGINFEK